MKSVLSVMICAMLTLAYPCQADTSFNALEETVEDSLVTTLIVAQYTKDTDLNPFKIKTKTLSGTVYLSGFVPNRQAYVQALRIAKKTPGVKSVNAEQLYVKRVNTTFTDTWITAKAEAAILQAKVFADDSIPLVGLQASTHNGIVTLTGTVGSAEAKAYIVEYVARIKGVKSVISKLKVKKSAAATVPF